jgi:ParB family chromosome partitioning protein
MSKQDKFNEISAGLGETLDKIGLPVVARAKTAPGQLMSFRNEMETYETRIAALETELSDAKRTEIPLNLIDPNPWQPRTYFDPQEILELASSISEIGLVQPVIVRRVQSLDTVFSQKGVQPLDTRYQLIAGERRLRAHKELGRSTIQAIITKAADDEMAMMALAENLDRADLAEYEISKAIRRAEKEFPNRKQMAKALGMERSDLYRFLAFDELPDFMKSDLEIDPRLLGRAAAAQVVSLIKSHGTIATDQLDDHWGKVKDGHLDQTKLAASVEASILGRTVRTDRDIKKLFIGKEQAGSITRDASSLTVRIKAAALSEAKETRLREFVQKLLVASE